MKKIFLALFCAVTTSINFASSVQPFKRPKPPLTIRTLTTSNFQTSISPLELNTVGTKTISTPGDYYLTDDIDFHPTTAPTAPIAIHITTSNVTLDLNSKQLSQATTNTTSLVQAIVIDPGLTNIFIHNGSIHNFSGAGIIVGENCKNVTLYKVSVTQCCLGGIYIGYNPFNTGTYATVFDGQEQIRVTDPANPRTTSTSDILLESVYVSGTTGYFSGTTTTYAHAIGIQIADVKNFQCLNTISNTNQYSAPTVIKNSTTNPGGYYVATRSGYMGCGINVIRSKNGYFEQSECSNSTGWAAYGYLIENCTCIDFQNCFANVNHGEGDPVLHTSLLDTTFNFIEHRDLGRAAGFMLNDSSGNHFSCCQANDTHGTRQAAGFWLRRYHLLTSANSIENSQYFDPTLIPSQITTTNVSGSCGSTIELEQSFIFPELPSSPPAIGTGYVPTTTPVYIQDGGSNWNHCIECQATHSHSDYLDAYGFLAQGNSNNWFEKSVGQSCMSGSGPSAYTPGGIANFDLSSGIWSLIEAPQYTSPHTSVIIQFAAGIALEALRLPLMQYNGTTKLYELQRSGTDLIFLAIKLQDFTTPPPTSEYALPYWSESCPNLFDNHFKDNMGSCVGTGVGALMNGALHGIIKNNWLSCNHSCTTGTNAVPCGSGSATGIGAQGGYGLLDVWFNCNSLIFDNKAFANQVIRPFIATCVGCTTTTTSGTGLGAFTEGANYKVTYTDPNLALPVESASIGDFSPFNILTPLSNFEWTSAAQNPSYKLLSRVLITSAIYPAVFTI